MKHYVMIALEEVLDEAAELMDMAGSVGDGEPYRDGVLDTLVTVLRGIANDDQRSAFQQLISLAIQGRRG